MGIAVLVVAILWAGRRPAEQAPTPAPVEQKTAAQPQAPEPERAVFLRLLECEDDKLWQWFMGRERSADKEFDALVHRITDLPC